MATDVISGIIPTNPNWLGSVVTGINKTGNTTGRIYHGRAEQFNTQQTVDKLHNLYKDRFDNYNPYVPGSGQS